MQELTEKQWENLCRGCSHPNLHVALLEYANLDEYLRRIVIIQENLKPYDAKTWIKKKLEELQESIGQSIKDLEEAL